MQLEFRSIDECGKPGQKWLEVFNKFWYGYKAWLTKNDFQNNVSLEDSKAAMEKYMPKMVPTYNMLCELVGNDPLAAKFLTGYQPPAYIAACAQAVTNNGTAQLVRNYDYSPDLLEGVFMLTKWNKNKVMGINDCIIGLVDGVNDAGLAISLTFGGRKEVGKGFGISFIMRYVLEFCQTVDQAVKCLTTIPSHMSYNVIVVDKKGKYKTVMVAPDREAIVTDHAYSTNHQLKVEWPENARFNRTIERSNFLKDALNYKDLTNEQLANIFLMSPMYNTKFSQGFGTLYTAVYQPKLGIAKLLWQGQTMELSFDDFKEQTRFIQFSAAVQSDYTISDPVATEPTVDAFDWQTTVADILASSLATQTKTKSSKAVKSWREKILKNGNISWEVIVEYWKNIGAHKE